MQRGLLSISPRVSPFFALVRIEKHHGAKHHTRTPHLTLTPHNVRHPHRGGGLCGRWKGKNTRKLCGTMRENAIFRNMRYYAETCGPHNPRPHSDHPLFRVPTVPYFFCQHPHPTTSPPETLSTLGRCLDLAGVQAREKEEKYGSGGDAEEGRHIDCQRQHCHLGAGIQERHQNHNIFIRPQLFCVKITNNDEQ